MINRSIIRNKISSNRRMLVVLAIIVFNVTGVVRAQNLLSNPECTVYDQAHHRYLVSCYGSGAIVQIDSNGQQSYFRPPSGHLLGNTICGNTLYVSAINSIKAFDLDSGNEIWSLPIPGSHQLDGMTCDNSGNLYVADFHYAGNQDQIYKINPVNQTYSIFVPPGQGLCQSPQDIIYDAESNRLIVACYYSAPIQAVSLVDSTVSTIVIPPMGNFDGIARDNDGNYYLTSWTTGGVHRYTPEFTNPPEMIINGLNGPANLSFNPVDNVLAIPEFDGDSVVFLSVFPVGQNEMEKSSLDVYPNPSLGKIQIKLRSRETGEVLVFLSTSDGKLVYSSNGRKSETEFFRSIDTSCLPSTLLILYVRTSSSSYHAMIINNF